MALAEQIVEKLPQDSILWSLTCTELDDFLAFGIVPLVRRYVDRCVQLRLRQKKASALTAILREK